MNLGHPKFVPGDPKLPQKWAKIAQKGSKMSQNAVLWVRIDPNGSNCLEKLQIGMGASNMTCKNQCEGLVAPKLVLEGPKLAKDGSKCSKWLKKQFCGSQWIKTVQIVWVKVKAGVGASNMTCLNPWKGLGANRMSPGWPNISQRWPKMLKVGSVVSKIHPKLSKNLSGRIGWVDLFSLPTI